MSKIQAFDFEIEYVKGENNFVAYVLSRRPSLSLMYISKDWKSILIVEYTKDMFSCELLEGDKGYYRYKVLNGLIYYKYQIYLVFLRF